MQYIILAGAAVFLTAGIILIVGFSNVRSTFEHELKELVKKQGKINPAKISEEELNTIPELLRNYLIKSGFAGMDKIKWVHAKYKGKFCLDRKSGKYFDIECEQYNSADLMTRLWYGKIYILPFLVLEGRHYYTPVYANMLIKFGPFTIVNIKGKEIIQSDTITFFNDMLLFMPSAIINKYTAWEPIDTKSVKANYSINGMNLSAVFYFNENNEVTNYITKDRYMLDGKDIRKETWSTPAYKYKVRDGLKILTSGDAVWKLPEGDYSYFRINDPDMILEYNVLPEIK
jgi:hypothetical protein